MFGSVSPTIKITNYKLLKHLNRPINEKPYEIPEHCFHLKNPYIQQVVKSRDFHQTRVTPNGKSINNK